MRKLLIALALSLTSGTVHADETIGFKKGDRVVFVGPTFVERTARFGHLETALTLAMPEKELIFRNLGWSADTVKGESRGYEKPQSGYANLLRSIRYTQATEVLSQSISPTSLMPARLTAPLSRDDFLHLTAFLSAIGKEIPRKLSYGPWKYPPPKALATSNRQTTF